MNRPQSLKLGALAQMLPIVLGYGANLLAAPFVVANLGLANFGLWAVTGALAQYGVLLDLGIPRAVMRYVALYHSQGREGEERALIGTGVMIFVIVGCLLMCLPLVISAQLSHLIGANSTSLTQTLFISSIVVFITGSLGAMLCGASIGRGRIVAVSIGLALQRVAVAVGGVIAIIFRPSLEQFAIGSAVGGGVGLVLVLLAILIDEREIRIGRPRISALSGVIAFGLKGQAGMLCELVLFQSGKLLAGIVIGPAAAGAYELGSRLALGARALSASAIAVVTAHLTRSYAMNGVAGIQRSYAKLVQTFTAVSNFALLFVAATSFSLVPLWLGVSHAVVVWVVIVLSLAYALSVSTGVTTAAASAMNQVGRIAVATLVGAVLAVALAIPLANIAGVTGILIGVVLATGSTAVIALILVHRGIGLPLTDFLRPVTGPFVVGGLSLALAMPVGIIWPPTDRVSAIGPFLFSAAIFCLVYAALGWGFGYLPSIKGIGFSHDVGTAELVTDD
jgi:O-antigen/teichoic acid export membrane protein